MPPPSTPHIESRINRSTTPPQQTLKSPNANILLFQLAEIDPSVIIPTSGGRPRRARPQVDYSSAEAMAKAGIDPSKVNEEDD